VFGHFLKIVWRLNVRFNFYLRRWEFKTLFNWGWYCKCQMTKTIFGSSRQIFSNEELMKKLIYTLTISTLLLNCTTGHQHVTTKSFAMKNFELSPENAHPNARKLLVEDFYWSPIEETGPFGSDDGSDSFYGFAKWRTENKSESPVTYLTELIQEWGYPTFDLNVIDAEKISQLLREVDSRMLIGQDNAIVAIGFGQFVLEGKMDIDIKNLTKKAIERELTPELLNQFRADYKETRKGQLQKMMAVLEKI
jgi:uncharacterized protein YfeS